MDRLRSIVNTAIGSRPKSDDSQPKRDYRYSSLKPGEIRLAKLFPGRFKDPILVELSHECLLGYGSPKYEALSYAWGSRENPRYIQIRDAEKATNASDNEVTVTNMSESPAGLGPRSGQQSADRLSITQNLEAALRHLRRNDSPRVLWIDAICIDQENPVERSAEVLRMGDIYKLAEKVVAWLGVSGRHTRAAMKLIQYIGQYANVNMQKHTINLTKYPKEQFSKRVRGTCFDCSYSAGQKVGLHDLLIRPWFSRLWIWQELCLAQFAVVRCGQCELDWRVFSDAVSWIDVQLRSDCSRHPDKLKIMERV